MPLSLLALHPWEGDELFQCRLIRYPGDEYHADGVRFISIQSACKFFISESKRDVSALYTFDDQFEQKVTSMEC